MTWLTGPELAKGSVAWSEVRLKRAPLLGCSAPRFAMPSFPSLPKRPSPFLVKTVGWRIGSKPRGRLHLPIVGSGVLYPARRFCLYHCTTSRSPRRGLGLTYLKATRHCRIGSSLPKSLAIRATANMSSAAADAPAPYVSFD